MQIITSHVNTDFDALASMIAAKKLYPNAQLVISDKHDNRVRRFLNIYRDTFDFVQDNQIDWTEVKKIVLVDVASLKRVSHFTKQLKHEGLHITLYDHHPVSKGDVNKDDGIVEQVGATVTLLIEEIQKQSIDISPFEATLFGLGLYTDTGAFTFKNTTNRDFKAASFLMEKGMNLEMIQQFSEQTLKPEQQTLLDMLFSNAKTIEMDGLEIIVSSCQIDQFIGDLSTLTTKLLEVKGADAAISVVGMEDDIFVVGRARSERITLLPILKRLGGGGHKHAGSAMIKKDDFTKIYNDVINNLDHILQPAMTAKDIMTSPVKTISPVTTIEEAGRLMYRYGHSGYPVVENDLLVGIITRRDLDKANHHGLGHAPVKAYMTTDMITIEQNETLEQIQQIIINHNIGRLPVMSENKLIGIISRTNIIEALYGEALLDKKDSGISSYIKENIKEDMQEQLPTNIYSLLQHIGNVASRQNVPVYLIGGIVRDLFLNVPNDDIDIVVEGDGIKFVKDLQQSYGGEIVIHESFGTATWHHPNNIEVDIASSRLEYYDEPASLPDVETSTLKEDLNRRDFTINAMAIYLNDDKFGTVVDPFSGQLDLYDKKIKILHNISFVEDPTRILRAVRFETRFNFLMDEQTEKLALQSIEKINDLSAERILNEMQRLFNEKDPLHVVKRLFELNFWQQFGVSKDQLQLSCRHVGLLQKTYNENKQKLQLDNLYWFKYFIIPFYKDCLDGVKRFAITKRDTKLLNEINMLSDVDISQLINIKDIHNQLKDYSTEAIVFVVSKESIKTKKNILDYVYKRNNLQSLLTGEDLLHIGLKPSPLYSEIFFKLDVAILEGQIRSKDDAITWVKQYVLEKQSEVKKE